MLACLLSTRAFGEPVLPAAATSPWDIYNAGVQAYAAGDYAQARESWAELSLETLPRGLRHPVWFQLANAHFRLGERQAVEAPEEAAEWWRRSAEAGRAALALKPRDAATRHNLGLVERRLAELLHRLGLESFDAADGRPRDEALVLLRAAVEQLEEAASLVPSDTQLRYDRDRVRAALGQGLFVRALDAERRGDEDAKQATAWSDLQADGRYRDALEDLAEAGQPVDPEPRPRPSEPAADTFNQAVGESRDRVNRKLAELLTRRGQREQQEGTAEREWSSDTALDRFEAALGHYQEAQAVQPGHEPAQRGEREVRRAMEQIHLEEGRTSLAQGRERLERRDPQSASSLATALDHFEATLSLNANNVPARNGAEEARRLLPEALALAGEAALQAGDRAEPTDPTEALARYREAETDFQQSLELEPGQTRAQQGLQDVEPRLSRLRQRLAQEAQNASPSNRRPPTLEGLLDQVTEREPAPETDRQRQRSRSRPGDRSNPRDW